MESKLRNFFFTALVVVGTGLLIAGLLTQNWWVVALAILLFVFNVVDLVRMKKRTGKSYSDIIDNIIEALFWF